MLYYAAPKCFRSYLSNQSEKLLQSNHPIQKHPLPFHDRAAVSRFHSSAITDRSTLVLSEQGRNGLHLLLLLLLLLLLTVLVPGFSEFGGD